MNAAAIVISALVASSGALAYLVVCDLLSQEVRARLDRLPVVVLQLAARQLPAELRTEIYEETWLPDLHHLLGDELTGPVTRLLRATRYALSLWLRRAGTHMADELLPLTPPSVEGFEDIRTLPHAGRKEFGMRTARLHAQLRHPAEAFDRENAARFLNVTAFVCEAYTADRDERAAANLAEAARPLAERLGSDHPAVLGVRRAYIHALLQLGHYERARRLLSELRADERRIFGPDDPRTFPTWRLLSWALTNTGRFREAEAEFRALDARMTQQGTDADVPLRLHVRCMLAWTIFCQGRHREAEEAYGEVIASRSRELGHGNGDTLDARHSKGKMLVQSGEGPRACAVLQPLLADRKRLQGARHPDTLETRKYLALARALGRAHPSRRASRRTLRALRRTMKAQNRKHGPDHPHTRDTRQWLSTLTESEARR